jgi:hypothetical protein
MVSAARANATARVRRARRSIAGRPTGRVPMPSRARILVAIVTPRSQTPAATMAPATGAVVVENTDRVRSAPLRCVLKTSSPPRVLATEQGLALSGARWRAVSFLATTTAAKRRALTRKTARWTPTAATRCAAPVQRATRSATARAFPRTHAAAVAAETDPCATTPCAWPGRAATRARVVRSAPPVTASTVTVATRLAPVSASRVQPLPAHARP